MPQEDSNQKMTPLCFDLLEQRAHRRITSIHSRRRKANTPLQQMLKGISYLIVFLLHCLQYLPHSVPTPSTQNSAPAIHSLFSLLRYSNKTVPKPTLLYFWYVFAYNGYRVHLHRECEACTNLRASRTKVNSLNKLLLMIHSPVQTFSGELGVLRFILDCTIVFPLKFWFYLSRFVMKYLSLESRCGLQRKPTSSKAAPRPFGSSLNKNTCVQPYCTHIADTFLLTAWPSHCLGYRSDWVQLSPPVCTLSLDLCF